MILIIGGILGLVGLLVAAAWMGALARREPTRQFRVGGRGVRTAEVTFALWMRSYFPWSATLCVVLIGLGLFMRAR